MARFTQPGMRHSSRAFGWPLAKQATVYWFTEHTDPEYAASVKAASEQDVTEALKPDINPPWASALVFSRENQRQFWPGAEWSNEAGWQAAVTERACGDWMLISIHEDFQRLRDKARWVIEKCVDWGALQIGENYRVFADGRDPEIHGEFQLSGTRAWCVNAMTYHANAQALWQKMRTINGWYRDGERRTWEWAPECMANLPYVDAE